MNSTTTMPIRAELAILTLGVADLSVTQAFYGDTLGFATERAAENLTVIFPTLRVVFEQSPPPERAKIMLAFRVDDATLDEIAQRVHASAGAIAAGPDRRDGGGRALYVTDPDHYSIEFFAS